VLGVGITGLLFASRLQTLRERAKADLAGDRASLIERLRHKDQQIDELRTGQRDLQAQLDYSRHELRDEAARRATAEAARLQAAEDARIAERAAEAEIRIRGMRDQAMGNVRTVAAETAEAMVEKLTGRAAHRAEIDTALGAA